MRKSIQHNLKVRDNTTRAIALAGLVISCIALAIVIYKL
jgi:hypothetical protein